MTAETTERLRARVRHLLQPGEDIVWIGQPDPRQFRDDALAAAVFALIPLAFGVGPFVALAATAGRSEALSFLPVGLVFVAIGLVCLAGPWRTARKVREAVYVLTRRRALILGAFGWGRSWIGPAWVRRDLYEFDARQLRARERKPRRLSLASRVDLVFGAETHRTRRGWVQIELGFFGLAEPDRVEAELDRHFPTAAQAPAHAP